MTTLVEMRGVTKVFGAGLIKRRSVTALHGFTLTIDSTQPSITGIVGESGSGKSTMARLLLGLETPTHGAVYYRGVNLERLDHAGWRAFRQDVQAVFQDPFESFNSLYRVDRMLETPLRKFKLATSRQDMRRRIVQALESVGLRPEETLGRYPHELSGGQRQRVMVARALSLQPKLIVADEPVSMIDASLRASVLANLRQLRDEFGISLVYITHDLTTAFQICDDVLVLYRGSVAEAGAATLVVQRPQHPYTQLLVSSIPRPDPDRQWPAAPAPSPAAAQAREDQGCLFARRCPHAFEPCLKDAPPFYRVDETRVAACYLHDGAPSLAPDALGQVLLKTSRPATARAVPADA